MASRLLGAVRGEGGLMVIRDGATSRPGKARVLDSIQAGRGIAALLVVLFHGSILVQSPKYWGVPPFGGAFTAGHSGVYFFFVLSGFVILWAHEKDIGYPGMLRRYLWKRAARIYPPLGVTLALVYAMLSAVGQTPSLAETAMSFLLVGPRAVSIIAVGWTLYHEVLFYALFALLIVDRTLGLSIFALWAVACLPIGADGSYYFSSLNYLFLIGLAAAYFLKEGRVPAPGRLLALGGLIFLGTMAWQLRSIGRQLEPGEVHGVGRFIAAYGFASCLLLLGSIELERANRLYVPRPLLLLGNASYSIYLVHYPVLSLVAKLLRPLPGSTAFLLIVLCGVVAGILFWMAVEKPLGRWLSAFLSRRSI